MHNVLLTFGSSKRSSHQFGVFDPLFVPLHDVAAQLEISNLAVASRSPAAEAMRQPCCSACEYGAAAHRWGASFAGPHFETDGRGGVWGGLRMNNNTVIQYYAIIYIYICGLLTKFVSWTHCSCHYMMSLLASNFKSCRRLSLPRRRSPVRWPNSKTACFSTGDGRWSRMKQIEVQQT